jgi:hypothetical protein
LSYSCVHVLEQGRPILRVSHDEDDGAWQFHCGSLHETEVGRLVCLCRYGRHRAPGPRPAHASAPDSRRSRRTRRIMSRLTPGAWRSRSDSVNSPDWCSMMSRTRPVFAPHTIFTLPAPLLEDAVGSSDDARKYLSQGTKAAPSTRSWSSAKPLGRYFRSGPGMAMKRCVNSESRARASRMPYFSITMKLTQSVKL